MCSKIKSPEQFTNIIELTTFFKTEAICLKGLEDWIWDGKIRCPHCGWEDPYRFKCGKRFQCKNCNEGFTAKVGTIFESSKLPLKKWFMAIYLISSHKKGISSCQLARDLDVTQKTAWFMLHRIRESMQQNEDKLQGVVQIDETFVGGKNKNRHIHKKVKYGGMGRSFVDKLPILGMISEETGEARTVVVPNVEIDSIAPQLRKHIEKGSSIHSDEYGYGDLKGYTHKSINHKLKRFNIDGVTTNKVENMWSQFKRTIFGMYHYISFKHLQRYANEMTFRFNTKKLKFGERLAILFKQLNCRIKYKHLISCHG